MHALFKWVSWLQLAFPSKFYWVTLCLLKTKFQNLKISCAGNSEFFPLSSWKFKMLEITNCNHDAHSHLQSLWMSIMILIWFGSGRFRFGSFLNNRLKWSVGRHLSDHNALIRFWFNGLVLSPWARPLCCWLHWSLEQPAPQLCNSLSFSLQFTFDFNSFHIYDLGLSLFQSQCTRHCHKSYWTCTGTVKPVLKRGVYIKENRVYWLLYSLLFYDT